MPSRSGMGTTVLLARELYRGAASKGTIRGRAAPFGRNNQVSRLPSTSPELSSRTQLRHARAAVWSPSVEALWTAFNIWKVSISALRLRATAVSAAEIPVATLRMRKTPTAAWTTRSKTSGFMLASFTLPAARCGDGLRLSLSPADDNRNPVAPIYHESHHNDP